jgi:predicted Rossmann fold nucleotide-binding protein DprA/Smf involved in DNA uptake
MKIYTHGNKELLNKDCIGLFCSRSIPLSLYYQAFDFLKLLMNQAVTIGSGWHSPLEKKALKSRDAEAKSTLIFFLAKGIHHFQVDKNNKDDIKNGKILIVSQWDEAKRIDQNKAAQRNRYMLNSLNKFLFLSINTGGNLEKIFKDSLEMGKNVYILDHPTNAEWINNGAIAISHHNIKELT